MKFPKTLGAAADLLYTLQQQRLEKSREVKALEKDENDLEAHILENMLPSSGLEGARGSVGQVSKKSSLQASVTDWDKYYAYIHKHKAYHLLHKKPTVGALKEIWDNKKAVPGVEPKEIVTLHVTKV